MKNLIKKILKEEFDDSDWFQNIKQFSPAEEFLYEVMSNLTMVPSKNNPGWVLYKNIDGETLMSDNINTGEKNPVLYIDYVEISRKLRNYYGLNYKELTDLCVRILEMTYKRKVSTVIDIGFAHYTAWK